MCWSRWRALAREAVTRGIAERISDVTVWRWLSQDAIKPWQHRSWIFPRDTRFAERAGPILDLYAGHWQGERLHPGDYVICADEKPSIQARKRLYAPLTAAPCQGQKVEHECELRRPTQGRHPQRLRRPRRPRSTATAFGGRESGGLRRYPLLGHCSSGPVRSTVAQVNHEGGSQPSEPAEVGDLRPG
jgi:hypothetical protein